MNQMKAINNLPIARSKQRRRNLVAIIKHTFNLTFEFNAAYTI